MCVAAATVVALAAPAAAAQPGYEPDSNELGSLSFYDASGAQVTSGTDLSHLFDYAAASTDAARSGTTKATLTFAYPNSSKPDSKTWASTQGSSSTNFPVATGPASITGLPARRPVVTIGATEANLAAPLQVQPLDQTAGYKDLVQVRLKDSGPGVANGVQSTFWATDIMFDTAANTWQQVYPAAASAQPTTTSLGASPASPQLKGTSVTFTSTISPTTAAGSIQFKDGTTLLGSPVPLTAGSAQYTTTSLAAGSHSITAVFAPDDATAFAPSTSLASTYVLTDVPGAPTNIVASPLDASATVTWNAPASNGGAAITGYDLQYGTDGTTWTSVTPAQTSTATSATVTGLTNGTGYFFRVAAINSVGTSAYAQTSAKVTPTKNILATTTTLAAVPASPQRAGTSVTLQAAVSQQSAAGTVAFKDGTTVLSSVAVSSGSASYSTTMLDVRTHSFTATFTPSDPTSFGSSTSSALSYVIADYPGTPTGVTATPVNTTANVSWVAPANTGGTPITGYDVQYSVDGTTWTSGAPASRTSTATSAVVSGLANGTAYLFRVRALNGVGSSSYQQTTTKVAPVADNTVVAIGAPRSVRAATAATLSVAVLDARDGSRVAGVPVSLYRRVAGQAAYSPVSTVVTSAVGTASSRITVSTNTLFQWRYAGNTAHNAAASVVVSVGVTPKVTISAKAKKVKHGKSIKVYGSAKPAPAGERVYLQRLLKGKWKNQASTTIHRQKLPNGRKATGYAFTRKLTKKGSYTFRVITVRTPFALGGSSGRLKARAT